MRTPPTSRTRLWIGASALAAYSLIVLAITLWPTPVDRGLEPLIIKTLSRFHQVGLPAWFGYATLEFGANILMFVPVGLLIAFVLGARTPWPSLIASLTLSIGIELTQATFLASRFAEINDVIANVIGATLGISAYFSIQALGSLRQKKPLH